MSSSLCPSLITTCFNSIFHSIPQRPALGTSRDNNGMNNNLKDPIKHRSPRDDSKYGSASTASRLGKNYSKASYTSTSSNAGGSVNSASVHSAVINIAILTDSIDGDEALISDVCRNSKKGEKIHGWLFNTEVRVCGISGHNPTGCSSTLPDNAVEMENLSGIRKWADIIIVSCPPVLAEHSLRSLVECYRQSLSVPSVVCLVLRPDYTLRFDRRGLLSMSDITTCTLRPNGLSAVGVVYHDGISGYAIGSHDPICSELMTSLLRKGRKPIEVEQSLPVELIYAVRPVILCAAEEVSLNGDQVIQRIPTSLKEEIYDLANLFGTGRDRKSLAQLIDLLLLRGDVQPTEMARMRLGCEISKWLEEKNLTRRFPVLNEYSKKCRIGDGTFGFVEM